MGRNEGDEESENWASDILDKCSVSVCNESGFYVVVATKVQIATVRRLLIPGVGIRMWILIKKKK